LPQHHICVREVKREIERERAALAAAVAAPVAAVVPAVPAPAAEWEPGVQGELQRRARLPSMLLVSADHVGSRDGEFLLYAALLAYQQILCRVVIDECHTAITAHSWQPKLAWLKDLELLPCQLILLTATLTPSLVDQLYKALLVRTATIVRARCTQRPGMQYTVLSSQRGELRKRAVQQAREMMEEAQSYPTALHSRDVAAPAALAATPAKGIVYCCSKQLCE